MNYIDGKNNPAVYRLIKDDIEQFIKMDYK